MKYIIVILLVLVGTQSYFLYSVFAEKTLAEYHYAQMGLTQSIHNVFFMREEKNNPTYLKNMLLCNIVMNFSQYEATYKNTKDYVWFHKHEVNEEFKREIQKVNIQLGKDIKIDRQYYKEFCYGNRQNW